MPFQIVESQRLYQQVAEQLGGLIDRGEFREGDRLPPERELSKKLGVSRPVVREAMIALEIAGLVEVRVGAGAFVSWKLYPRVRISLDSRYEVAFEPALLTEHVAFFDARDGWQRFLAAYPTDLVLAPADAPIASALATQAAWTIVYRDDAFTLFARPGLSLPTLDRRDHPIVGTFP